MGFETGMGGRIRDLPTGNGAPSWGGGVEEPPVAVVSMRGSRSKRVGARLEEGREVGRRRLVHRE